MKKILQNKNFQAFLLLFLTIIVLFFLLKDNFQSVILELKNMNIIWIIVSLLLIFIYWFFKAIGAYIITRQIQPKFSIKDSLKINFIVYFFNSITPFAVGGHPVQVNLLRKKGISITNGANITIQNFIVYQIAVIIIQFFSIIFALKTNLFGENIILKNLVFMGMALDFSIILFLFILAFSKKTKFILINFGISVLTKLRIVKDKEETLNNWHEKINRFHIGAIALIKNKKDFLTAIFCNLLGIIAFYLSPLTLVYATGNYYSITSIQSIYITACIIMMADLIPTPGQIGGVEYGFTSLFGNFINSSILSAVLITWRFLSYYLIILIGGITLNIKKKRKTH